MNKRLATLIAALMPMTAFAADWQSDYGKALKLGKERDVPVFVYFTDNDSTEQFASLADLTKDFVLVKAVKNTPAGDKVFKLFEMEQSQGCAVVERTQSWQYARYERQLSTSELETVLRRTKAASGEPTVDVLQTVSYEESTPQPQVIKPTFTTFPSWSNCSSCRR